MSERMARRRERLARVFRAEDVSAFLVVAPTNVGYLTGFRGEATALILTRDRAVAVSDGRFRDQLERNCPDVEAHIRPVGQPLMAAVAEVVGKLGPTRVAVEASHLTVADQQSLSTA